MSDTTQPVFIVSSGRSGTQMCHKLLSTFAQVEAHHEYLCTHVQPLAVLFYRGIVSQEEVVRRLEQFHGTAVHYSDAALWVDASNKLSWLIGPLAERFPQAKFVHLIRDGRKVASSFYHKLGDEIYDDRSVSILKRYLAAPDHHRCPPPEKKYWWNLPRPAHPAAAQFEGYDQFQRICFHWAEVNRVILRDLERVPADQQMRIKLEDLVHGRNHARAFLQFLGLGYSDYHFALLERPHNVNIPQNFPLSRQQTNQLWEIAGDIMNQFGYHDTPEYEVAY